MENEEAPLSGSEEEVGYEEVEEEQRGMDEWNGYNQMTVAEDKEMGEDKEMAEDQEVVEPWKPGQPATTKQVLRMNRYTRDYLCTVKDNIYNINFSRFKIRDLENGSVILDIKRDIRGIKPEDIPVGRFIRYRFNPSFLSLRDVGALLEFSVGGEAVSCFRLIERHFFRNRLLKTFDFDLGFCIPNSVNTCEHIYCLPDLDPELVDEIIANPWETRSDSFYFANNTLIMHHKAEYSFRGGRRSSRPSLVSQQTEEVEPAVS